MEITGQEGWVSTVRVFSFKRRVYLALVLFLCVLVGTAWWSYIGARDTLIRTMHNSMQVMVEDRHVVIEQFLNQRRNLLIAVAGQIAAHSTTNDHSIDLDSALMTSTFDDMLGLYLVDGEEDFIAESGASLRQSLADDGAWFSEAKNNGFYMGQLQLDESNQPGFVMAAYSRQMGRELVLATKVSTARLSQLLEEFRLKSGSGTYIVDPISGIYLTRPYFGGEPLVGVSRQFSWGRRHEHVDYDHHGVEEVGVGRYTNPSGDKVLGGYCCVRSGRWLVVLETPEAEILNALEPVAYRLLFAVIVLAISALVIALHLSNRARVETG